MSLALIREFNRLKAEICERIEGAGFQYLDLDPKNTLFERLIDISEDGEIHFRIYDFAHGDTDSHTIPYHILFCSEDELIKARDERIEKERAQRQKWIDRENEATAQKERKQYEALKAKFEGTK